jgi:hypothetical protein
MKLLSLLLFLPLALPAQTSQQFEEFFQDRALRIDLYQVGNATEEFLTLDRVVEEGPWPENPAHLLEPFQRGRYTTKVFDIATNRLIYSNGFDCMFGEYRTTTPAINGVKRTFQRSLRIPYPKKPFLLVIEKLNKENIPSPLFTQRIDPADYHILHESSGPKDFVYEALHNGDPHTCVDLVFLAEGYTLEERGKFTADVDTFATALFSIEPYKSLKKKFNIRAIHRPSTDSGIDEPREHSYKRTALGSSFNAFDLDRYALTEQNHLFREIAGQVPYDAIVILVNSKRYGGGGIYNDYCLSTVGNAASKSVFVHEFGHAFGGLGDEYYSSDVAYNDFYPKGVEPLEPNITALLDPSHVKWQDVLSPGIAIPTPYGRDEKDSLQALRRKATPEQKKELEAKIADVERRFAGVADKVGAFEGAGYSAKGLYRPMEYCLMIRSPKNEFCLVCRKALEEMIRFYSGD